MMRDASARLPFSIRKDLKIIENAMNFVKVKFLYDATRETVEQVTKDEECLSTKAHMVFVHTFLNEAEIQPTIEEGFKNEP